MGDGQAISVDPTILKSQDLPLLQSKLAETLQAVLPPTLATLPISKHIVDVTALFTIFDNEPNPNRVALAEAEGDASDRLWRAAVAMTPLSEWRECTVPYLTSYIINAHTEMTDKTEIEAQSIVQAEAISTEFRKMALGDVPDSNLDDDEDGSNLCNIEFSLAFGGKILLHNTRLKLGKGRRYGLMGKNGAGKTTLLTNIGSGNIEGLPTHLRMIYVQHDDRSEDYGRALVDELIESKEMMESKVTKEQASDALAAIGFTPGMLASLIPLRMLYRSLYPLHHLYSLYPYTLRHARVPSLESKWWLEDETAHHKGYVSQGRCTVAG